MYTEELKEQLREQTIEVDFFGKKVKNTPRMGSHFKRNYYPNQTVVCLPNGKLKTVSLNGKIIIKEGNHFIVHFPTAIIKISKNESVVKLGMYDEYYRIHYFTAIQDGVHTVINETFINKHVAKVSLAIKELNE